MEGKSHREDARRAPNRSGARAAGVSRRRGRGGVGEEKGRDRGREGGRESWFGGEGGVGRLLGVVMGFGVGRRSA